MIVSRKEIIFRYIRLCIIGLTVDLLAFPPGLIAQQQAANWAGGPGAFSDGTKWSTGFSPSNGLSGNTYLATIASGNTDSVADDVSNIVLDGLILGYASPAPPATSTLSVANGGALTLGTSTGQTNSNVLAIYNGGTLNATNGSSVTLDLSGPGSGALVDTGGSLTVDDSVTSGGALTVRNNSGTLRALTDNGSISVSSTGTLHPASLTFSGNGAGSSFQVSGSGTLSLTGTGTLHAANQGTVDLTGVSFTNIGGGALSNGNLVVDSGATLTYTGGAITTIDSNASLTAASLTGALEYNDGTLHDALANSLSAVHGSLTITGAAGLTLSTDDSVIPSPSNSLSVTSGSVTLTNGGLTNSSTTLNGASTPAQTLNFQNSALNLNGFNLNNTATDNSSGALPAAAVNFSGGNTVTSAGSLNNTFNDNSTGGSASSGAATVSVTGGDKIV
ncbi:MAG: hypothetical protein KGN84_00685, partial [Acidobacteriota bacterium]|nr:hypothetical protein [Acidobacteriota bacterium]